MMSWGGMGGVWGGTVDCTLLILFFFFHSVYMQAFCMGGGGNRWAVFKLLLTILRFKCVELSTKFMLL